MNVPKMVAKAVLGTSSGLTCICSYALDISNLDLNGACTTLYCDPPALGRNLPNLVLWALPSKRSPPQTHMRLHTLFQAHISTANQGISGYPVHNTSGWSSGQSYIYSYLWSTEVPQLSTDTSHPRAMAHVHELITSPSHGVVVRESGADHSLPSSLGTLASHPCWPLRGLQEEKGQYVPTWKPAGHVPIRTCGPADQGSTWELPIWEIQAELQDMCREEWGGWHREGNIYKTSCIFKRDHLPLL